ncbi:GTP pyrophosphokinase [Bacillus sp. FJAT-27225]|uniref:GTP pyrophosphokinase n=1 Tax=Bacillus sp. FJAT-27225 TaxID=1743144 RepID=UPI00080C20D6|nr:GTP pyrophosphokinase family protein [Bacillus sp. FJAT-27225]OCA84159.1 GTP pyrophosphokinase [Bacillus sp. FJAT-27225]
MNLHDLKNLKTDLTRFMMAYKFAVDEVETKINILREEFQFIHDYSPIEHVTSRVKSPERIIKKVMRKKLELSLPSIKEHIRDIAGIRITCSFVPDIYKVSEMLQKQKDITVVETKDYIQNPKPNGYRSLHLIIEIPIFMSDRVEHVPVEIQIRTIAMDFWASLEHKIFYKYNKDVPDDLLQELKEAATAASMLDQKMQRINEEIKLVKEKNELDEMKLNGSNNTLAEIPFLVENFLLSGKK